MGRLRRDENGQLMLLAGIVLTISFIVTALTLAQVSSLEREAQAQGPQPIIQEWRFLHERLASNVRLGIGYETTQHSFETTVLPAIGATFRSLAAEKGYDLVLRLSGSSFGAKSEHAKLADPGAPTFYDAWAADGSAHYEHGLDPTDDGMIWQNPCPAPSVTGGCLSGVYLYVRLTDGQATMEEHILFSANQA